MNRDDIIRMAESCGIPEFENYESQADNIVRFAQLVAEAEREACAKLCEEYNDGRHANAADLCADAIRARGEA